MTTDRRTANRARLGLAVALVFFATVGAACGADPDSTDTAEPAERRTTTTGWPTSSSPTSTTTTAPVIEPTPPGGPMPEFHATIAEIDEATRLRMSASWREGCPVPLADLRLITMDHWDFAGEVSTGEMVVHADSAEAVVRAFGAIFAAQFPIERMELVDAYGADDDASMAANNTSAFNCRGMTGNAEVWSEHSYGRAIDINPVQNPYVTKSSVLPPNGAPYVDRSSTAPGVIHRADAVVQAFADIGWPWGGDWTSTKDYQHFSATGE